MNLVIKKYNPYTMNPNPILSAIMSMNADPGFLESRENWNALNNRCYFVSDEMDNIYAAILIRQYGENEEIIMSRDISTSIREAHYKIEYLLAQNAAELFNSGYYLPNILYTLIKEACADTTNLPVIINAEKQIVSNIGLDAAYGRDYLYGALALGGFHPWAHNTDYWLRVSPINFEQTHR